MERHYVVVAGDNSSKALLHLGCGMYLVGVKLRQLKYVCDAPHVRCFSGHAHSQHNSF